MTKLANEFFGKERHMKQAVTCSILLWELIGLRMCKFSNNDYMEVYNPKNHSTEYKFDMKTGEEIV